LNRSIYLNTGYDCFDNQFYTEFVIFFYLFTINAY